MAERARAGEPHGSKGPSSGPRMHLRGANSAGKEVAIGFAVTKDKPFIRTAETPKPSTG
jgi:hypothetical protein